MKYIDEDSIQTTVLPITKDNLPKGSQWQADGACFEAILCDPAIYGCEWRWSAKNLKAFNLGKPNASMSDIPPFSNLKRK